MPRPFLLTDGVARPLDGGRAVAPRQEQLGADVELEVPVDRGLVAAARGSSRNGSGGGARARRAGEGDDDEGEREKQRRGGGGARHVGRACCLAGVLEGSRARSLFEGSWSARPKAKGSVPLSEKNRRGGRRGTARSPTLLAGVAPFFRAKLGRTIDISRKVLREVWLLTTQEDGSRAPTNKICSTNPPSPPSPPPLSPKNSQKKQKKRERNPTHTRSRAPRMPAHLERTQNNQY